VAQPGGALSYQAPWNKLLIFLKVPSLNLLVAANVFGAFTLLPAPTVLVVAIGLLFSRINSQ